MGAPPTPPRGHAIASIEQRASGSWSVYWRNAGRRGKQRITVGADAEKLALRILDLVNARQNKITAAEVERLFGLVVEIDDDGEVTKATPTVDELADRWLETRTRIAGRQRRDYRSKLDRVILPPLRPLTVDLVRGSHITKILTSLAATRSNATVDRYYMVIQSLFKFAVAEDHIERSPVDDTDWTVGLTAEDDIDEDDDNDGHVYLTESAYRRLVAGFTGIDRDLVEYLAGTGSRWSEATALQVRDLKLDVEEPFAWNRRAWKQDEHGRWFVGITKGRRKRKCYLGPHLVQRLRLLTKDRKPEDLVFTAHRGGRVWIPNFRRRRWDPAVAAMRRCPDHPPQLPPKPPTGPRRKLRPTEVSTCDCPGMLADVLTPHDLRHSWTAWQIAAGKPLVAISKALGHGSTEVTEKVYAGILPEVRQSLAQVADAVLSGATGERATDGDRSVPPVVGAGPAPLTGEAGHLDHPGKAVADRDG